MSLDDRLRAITLEHDSAARQRAYEALAREVMASVSTATDVEDGFEAFMDHSACDNDATMRRCDDATRATRRDATRRDANGDWRLTTARNQLID